MYSHDDHDCTKHPAHRVAWLQEYERLAALSTPSRIAVEDALARVRGQESGHRKRTDRAIAKRREQCGGEHPTGPMPLLNVGRKGLDRAEENLNAARAQREQVYNEIREHRNSCTACRTALDEALRICDACGLRRQDVEDDKNAGELAPGVPWQRCAACRAAGVTVPA